MNIKEFGMIINDPTYYKRFKPVHRPTVTRIHQERSRIKQG